jgi:Mg-chelatase subunit ChlD
VQVFSPTGQPQPDLRGLPGVRALAVSPAGDRVYALHLSLDGPNSAISVFNNGASTPQSIISSGELPGGFAPGTGVAIGADGRLAVTIDLGSADGRQGLRVWNPTTRMRLTEAVANPLDYAGFFRPEAMAVSPTGELYLAEGLLQTTRRYAPDGAFRGLVARAVGQELAFGPTGELYVVNGGNFGGAVTLRRVDPSGVERYTKNCDCLSGLGVAATADRVFGTDAYSRTLGVFDQLPNSDRRIGRVDLAGQPYSAPVDVSRGPDGRLYVAAGDGGVRLVDPVALTELGGWPAGGGGAERLDVGPDGTVFVLRYDGSLAAFHPDGTLERAWTPERLPGGAVVRAMDLAAGPGGRLYVLDGPSRSVLVYDPQSGVAPTPQPTAEPPCTVTGDKTATPRRVALGEAVDVALTLEIRCRAGTETRADVMLIIDRSGSMAGKDPPTKLDKAKEAADGFVRRLDLSRHRVGLVSFETISSLDQPLTADLASITGAIAAVQPSGSTDIAAATERALRHLRASARPDAVPVILMLTDGEPSGSHQAWIDAVRVAARARATGVLFYTIGLGDNVRADLLTTMAGAASRYFYAPTGDELDPIYRQISQVIGEVVASDLLIEDVMGPDVDFVPGTAPGATTADNRTLSWSIGAVPATPVRLSLQVRPRRAGLLPTNARAVAQYTAAGQRYSFVFPVPEVEVIPPASETPSPTDTPTATLTPTATDTPTATATRTPRPAPQVIYLPILLRGNCRASEARLGADIVLAIDTSSSMAGEKLSEAKLAAQLFLTDVDERRDRVALVSFAAVARRDQPLTADLPGVARKIAALASAEGTNLEAGLSEARAELLARARPGSQRVVVLLSDGQPTVGTPAGVVAQAAALKQAGTTVFAIGLGADADAAMLRAVASSSAHYYFAPTAGDLTNIYERVAANLPCR